MSGIALEFEDLRRIRARITVQKCRRSWTGKAPRRIGEHLERCGPRSLYRDEYSRRRIMPEAAELWRSLLCWFEFRQGYHAAGASEPPRIAGYDDEQWREWIQSALDRPLSLVYMALELYATTRGLNDMRAAWQHCSSKARWALKHPEERGLEFLIMSLVWARWPE